MDFLKYFSLIIILLIHLQTGYSCIASAQVVFDGTLGPPGPVPGPDYAITAGFGQQQGSNLFHSFKTFNIDVSETATFSGPDSVSNIISRVTGGTKSVIDGKITAAIPDANLYFLNPAGIMFGPSASLDISGSFHASTADYVLLGDNGRFDAGLPEKSVLSSAPVEAFGFLSPRPSPVQIHDCTLTVREDQTVSIVSGDIDINDGCLFATSGNVNLISAASRGEVKINDGQFTPSGFTDMGSINISDSRPVSDRPLYPDDPTLFIGNLEASGQQGGSVFIRGGSLVLDNGIIGANTLGDGDGEGIDISLADTLIADNGSQLQANSSAAGRGGNIILHSNASIEFAGSMQEEQGVSYPTGIYSISNDTGQAGVITISTKECILSDSAEIGTIARNDGNAGDINFKVNDLSLINKGGIYTYTTGSGNAGSISLQVDTLALDNESVINSSSYDAGSSGKIDIMSNRKITLDNSSNILSNAEGAGHGENISLASPTIEMDNWSWIMAQAQDKGNSGNLDIAADELFLTRFASIRNDSNGAGNSGSISLEVKNLVLEEDASITNTITSSGHGGNIYITAEDSIWLSGILTEISCNTYTQSKGSGGNISIFSPALILDASAEISAQTYGQGNAGNISIHCGETIINDYGEISTSSWGPGHAGDILFDSGILLMIDGHISTSSNGSGQAGSMLFDLQSLGVLNGSTISSGAESYDDTFFGDAGDIQMIVSDKVVISGYLSKISSNTNNSGDGGDLIISTPTLRLDNQGVIDAGTMGDGRSGNIDLVVDSLEILSGSNISTGNWWSSNGAAGDITINSSDSVTISGDLSYISSGTDNGSPGGDITISTSDLLITDLAYLHTGIFYLEASTGQAGNITLNADTLTVTDGGRITSENLGYGGAGNIFITAQDSVLISGKGNKKIESEEFTFNSGLLLNTYSGMKKGGDLHLQTGNLSISGGAQITTESSGQSLADAGDISISTAGDLTLKNASITSEAASAEGGGITINSASVLRMTESEITTSVSAGLGNGGNIAIQPPIFIILEQSDIIANAHGGNGGNIYLKTDYFLSDPESLVQASSELGVDGSVNLDTPNIDFSSAFANLPESNKILEFNTNTCETNTDVTASSLIHRGQGGLPPDPEIPLSALVISKEPLD